MIKLKKIRPLILLAVVYLSLPVFLLLTNPQELPLPVLIIPIAIVFVLLYATASYIIRQIRPDGSKTRNRVVAGLFAGLPTVLVVLQTIQQLSFRDVVIVLIIWLILTWYLLKIDID